MKKYLLNLLMLVDIEILANIDDETLEALCLSDKYAQSLCEDDSLWED